MTLLMLVFTSRMNVLLGYKVARKPAKSLLLTDFKFIKLPSTTLSTTLIESKVVFVDMPQNIKGNYAKNF